jgi:hypothetical protein
MDSSETFKRMYQTTLSHAGEGGSVARCDENPEYYGQ